MAVDTRPSCAQLRSTGFATGGPDALGPELCRLIDKHFEGMTAKDKTKRMSKADVSVQYSTLACDRARTCWGKLCVFLLPCEINQCSNSISSGCRRMVPFLPSLAAPGPHSDMQKRQVKVWSSQHSMLMQHPHPHSACTCSRSYSAGVRPARGLASHTMHTPIYTRPFATPSHTHAQYAVIIGIELSALSQKLTDRISSRFSALRRRKGLWTKPL